MTLHSSQMHNSASIHDRISLSHTQLEIYRDLYASYPSLTHLQRLMVIFSKKTLEKAQKCARKFSKLISKYELNHIDENEVELLLRKHMMFALVPSETFHDTQGHGVLLFRGGSFEPGSATEKTIIQATYFLIELLMRQNEVNLREGITFLGDLHNFGWKNFDFRLEKLVQQIFGFLPIRLKKSWLVNSPWYVKMMMGMIRPFMSQKMVERYEVCSSVSNLLAFFEEKNLPEVYGGKAYLDEEAQIGMYVQELQIWNERLARERDFVLQFEETLEERQEESVEESPRSDAHDELMD